MPATLPGLDEIDAPTRSVAVGRAHLRNLSEQPEPPAHVYDLPFERAVPDRAWHRGRLSLTTTEPEPGS